MIETIALLPGVTLRVCRDSRFKQGCLSFQLVRQMRPEEAALNALLPSVLLRGTKQHPSLRAITHRLDELYGASVAPLVRRIGDYQTTGLYCGFMDDRFALPGDQVLAPMLSFVLLLTAHGRIRSLPACVEEYRLLYQAAVAMSTAYVTSAVALTEAQQSALAEKLAAKFGRRVELVCEVDESLLGGLTVRLDGVVLDGSLRRRLQEVKDVIEQ